VIREVKANYLIRALGQAALSDTARGKFDIGEMILLLFASIFGSAVFYPLFPSGGDVIWGGAVLGITVYLSYVLLKYALIKRIVVKGVEFAKFLIAGILVQAILGNFVAQILSFAAFLAPLATGIAFYIALWILGLIIKEVR